MGKPEKPKVKTKPEQQEELPWDLFDRCLLPVIFSHAAAVILSTILNVLYISQVSSFTLFLLFLIFSVAGVVFYHTLKVSAAGKCVLVTSCDSKIGIALVKQLDELGFTVFAGFAKKNEESNNLKELCSGRVHIIELDVTSDRSVKAVVEYIKSNLPEGSTGLWALVNSAHCAAFGEVEWVPLAVYKEAAEVNLLSVIRVTQAFLPLIRKTRGRVINIVSILGRVPSAIRSPYCSMKFGVEAFSDCLRLEMRRWGVDVVVVEPGDYTTGNVWFDDHKLMQDARNMWRQMTDEAKQDYGKDYFEFQVRSLERYTKGPETDLIPVIRSLTDAVSRSFPLSRYTPVTRSEKIQAFVSDHLPRSVYEILYT
ncbi:UNVERIFIED_CONTAM: hypothetical protein PYX00_003401 [Menopon gallinae]|uniref:D-beta-hydroxybutyrate dehydrogenase, mitochondrial n=1 Tax=Menopon gallinae TaxID=328185 RepID=A0AAW2I1G6_9NEOP